ncbi:Tyramine beta-hydroxylase [Biomphalaria glabrata]|nr:tyramine beta-hydroxylase-like [Biomphalaria glabrata]
MLAIINIHFLIVLLLPCVKSYRIFQQSIPNGDAVPHPCKPNNLWEGVGHFNDQGTGFRNPFGEDFEKEGKMWTEALCRKDSDGDGLTNGQELGDPDCVWKENTLPSRLNGLSHPGVCDPWDSPDCFSKNLSHPRFHTQEEWLKEMCKPKEFICPGLNTSDIQTANFTVSLGTKVPAKETTYMCQIFDFEKMAVADDYHVVAVEPVLDNKYVIHHMVLFGCRDNQVAIAGPFECGMVPSDFCTHVISIWTVGLAGDCFHPQAGITIGTKGFKRIAVQLHWNNPDSRSDWTDSSGMKAYFTNKKRPYEAGFYITGHEHFVLPPLQPSVTFTSTCTSACTSKTIRKPFNITLAWNHMHYAGKQMSVQIVRNKTETFYLSNDIFYSYDSPQVQLYTDNPVQIFPGDEIITKCTFTTARRNRSTFWGEATMDEMCYGFLIYFPKENVQNSVCFTSGPDVSTCDTATYHGCTDLTNFKNPDWLNATSAYQDLVKNCRPFTPCLQECVDTIVSLKRTDPCFKDDLFDFIKTEMLAKTPEGLDLMARFSSCERHVYQTLNTVSPTRA